tara:strand:+ start:244 stop:420 length:177 start_codon:yes stop_codon:yes gene_type:complete
MYFIIFKPTKENEYRLFSNQIFGNEEDALSFAERSFKRKDDWKSVEYTIENVDDYWYV